MLYQQRRRGAARASIYLGGATLVMVLDLLLLAVGHHARDGDRPEPVVSDVGRDHLRGWLIRRVGPPRPRLGSTACG